MSHVLGSPAPIFRVNSVRSSLAYYTEVLGFDHDWGEGGLASVSRDHCTIFLCEWEQGQRGTWVWLSANDVDGLHDELVRRGARVRLPPTNFDWAYEMQVEDPDGNVLRIGMHPKEGEPYGAFLDGAGVLWQMTAEGWTSVS